MLNSRIDKIGLIRPIKFVYQKFFLFILFFSFIIETSSAQLNSLDSDTILFQSKTINVLYESHELYNLQTVIRNSNDSIFSSDFNKFSKIIICNNYSYDSVSLSTIPISDLIIDDRNGLIICLSRIQVSPWNIVIYNFDGKLMAKKKILPLELKIDSADYIIFKETFPSYYKYAFNQKQITYESSFYFVDMGYWKFMSEQKKQLIRSHKWVQVSHYFPKLFTQSTLISEIRPSEYINFYSRTDPFYEIVQLDITLNIVLNNEFGKRVAIPLGIID